MEERPTGGKEKKYVLYTVVNEDKTRTGAGVWIVRILLGTLLLVALAVVPYVSLRLAQVNDRTLVVFQPVPIRNHSKTHHHKTTSHRPGSVAVTHILHAASLVSENYTTEIPSKERKLNASLVTLHESAVTLSLLEDTDNITKPANNQSVEEDIISFGEVTVNVTLPLIKPNKNTKETNDKKAKSSSDSESVRNVTIKSNESVVLQNTQKAIAEITETEGPEEEYVTTPATPEVPSERTSEENINENVFTEATTTTAPKTTAESSTTTRPIAKFSSPKSGIIHKLAYVATASSGNHVGGICVWKTNKDVTKWSYFYDNIPIEYQSHQDSTDHEMRALLAAVRLWSSQWHDYHVVLRSQHQSIEGSKHHTRKQFAEELDQLSEEHFTYELEWRQRKDDSLMGIAYCLARLHKDFDYWFNEFERHVDELLGAQDWPNAKEQNRFQVAQALFVTKQMSKPEEKVGSMKSLRLY